MSGTSLDGLDIALCECSNDKVHVREFSTVPYSTEFRASLSAIQSRQQVDLEQVCVLNAKLARVHAGNVLQALSRWGLKPNNVDVIASHGQTIYHRPEEGHTTTLQIGDGDHIAHLTGIITVSDFRQKHVAAGGQGAPLAAIMDERLYRDPEKNRMLLNLGGIANFTWLPSKHSGGSILTSDTGPANTLVDQAMERYFQQPYDRAGSVASSGNVNSGLLKYLLLEPFFRKEFPKTTGQEDFNLPLIEKLMQGYRLEVSPQDLIATLSRLTIKSIERAFDQVTVEKYELYVSGGGIHNPVIMNGLKEVLEHAEFKPLEDLGMSPDAKEASLMAFLAHEFINGNASRTGSGSAILGKLSLP